MDGAFLAVQFDFRNTLEQAIKIMDLFWLKCKNKESKRKAK